MSKRAAIPEWRKLLQDCGRITIAILCCSREKLPFLNERENYEAICDWVHKVLARKPEWVDAFIAVRIDGEPIREYAARIGADENNITQKLKRAEKKLADAYHDFAR